MLDESCYASVQIDGGTPRVVENCTTSSMHGDLEVEVQISFILASVAASPLLGSRISSTCNKSFCIITAIVLLHVFVFRSVSRILRTAVCLYARRMIVQHTEVTTVVFDGSVVPENFARDSIAQRTLIELPE
jgi:hypothetical protein